MDCHHHRDICHCLDVAFSSMEQAKLLLLCDYENLAIPCPRCHSLHIPSLSECCSVQKTETFERIWSIQAGGWSIEKINCQGSSFNVDCNHFCHQSIHCLVTTTLWCKIHFCQENLDHFFKINCRYSLGHQTFMKSKLETIVKQCWPLERWCIASICLQISLSTSTCYGKKGGLWKNLNFMSIWKQQSFENVLEIKGYFWKILNTLFSYYLVGMHLSYHLHF